MESSDDEKMEEGDDREALARELFDSEDEIDEPEPVDQVCLILLNF